MTFWGETEHFSGKNGALRWSILVGKQKHNVQKPTLKPPCVRKFAASEVSLTIKTVTLSSNTSFLQLKER